MQTPQADYFAAYRNLKLSRDDKGVLVAEFHSDGGQFIMTAQSHTEFVDAFHRIGQDRANKIVIITGAGGNFIGDVEWPSFGDVADPGVWSRIHDEGVQVLEPVREHIESSESFVIQGRRPDSFGRAPMWTSKNRRRYDRSRLRYSSDVTDEEWALVEPLIPPAKRGGNRRHVVVREVINGLMYIMSTGCQWRAIPKDLPPRSTLYDYFDLWSWDGTLDRIHDALYAQCRQAASREASPTAAIIDSQSVKSAEKGDLRLIRRAMTRARVRPEGAYHPWRKIPSRKLSIGLEADERFSRVTGWTEAS